jgi:hypothetical protein
MRSKLVLFSLCVMAAVFVLAASSSWAEPNCTIQIPGSGSPNVKIAVAANFVAAARRHPNSSLSAMTVVSALAALPAQTILFVQTPPGTSGLRWAHPPPAPPMASTDTFSRRTPAPRPIARAQAPVVRGRMRGAYLCFLGIVMVV